MYTKITLNTSGDEPGVGATFWVQESYDDVFDKIYPETPARSALEARQNFMYTKHDGTRVAIHHSNVVTFEEVTEVPDLF